MYYYVRKMLILMHPDPKQEQGGGDPKPEEQNDKKPEETDTVALAKALKEARENSVPKSEYDKIVAEKNKLVSEIINGEDSAGNGQHETAPTDLDADIKKLREDLYGPKCSELNNLDFWVKTLALRDAVIKKGDPDPFLPVGAKISPTDDDAVKAQNVADVVQQCIDEADGNSEVFTALLQSRTNNDSPQLAMRLKKLGSKK